jgi:type IV pilus assembly protein PilO
MSPALDKLQKIPTKTRVIVFFSVIGVLIVLFIWQVYIPKTDQIRKLEGEIAGLQAKIKANEEKIRQLDALKAEVAMLRQRLAFLKEQLPPETEVSGLLRQIQNLVNQSGLSLKVWKPERRRVHQSGLYAEIPITLNIAGGYHNFGMFFDRVSKMTRIVNIINITMGSAKREKGGAMTISVGCTAMTFAAVETKPDAAQPAKKKTK